VTPLGFRHTFDALSKPAFDPSTSALEPPLPWIRLGALIAGVGYAIAAVHGCLFMRIPPSDWLQEAGVAVVGFAALGIAAKRPRVAARLTIGAVWLEVMLSLWQTGRLFSTSVLVIPVLVAAGAVVLRSREAYGVAFLSAVTVPAAVYGSRWAHGDMSLVPPHPNEAHWLLTVELGLFATVLIVRATVDSHARALVTSERERRRYTDLFEHAPDGLLALDEAGRIVESNAAATRLLRTDATGLTGADIRKVLGKFGAAAEIEVSRLRGPELLSVELASDDGSVRTLEISTWVVRDAPGNLTLLAIRDVSERRMLEERLRHAQRLETVGQLAGGVAHDFNNILTTIGGNADVLGRHTDPLVRTAAAEILKAFEHGAALTRQLLAFGRRDVRQPQMMDLAEAVTETANLVERVLGEERTLILLRDTRVPVVADRGQIEQIVLNLAANARDAMPQGGELRIDVRPIGRPEAESLGSTLAADRQALLEVRDTGVGMTPEVRARVFEPFFTTKPRGQGTGLGLSTVHGIVGQSSGHVTVETAPGKGTRFRVFFPLADATPSQAPTSR
jgi:PAS domain S-box-containing protein